MRNIEKTTPEKRETIIIEPFCLYPDETAMDRPLTENERLRRIDELLRAQLEAIQKRNHRVLVEDAKRAMRDLEKSVPELLRKGDQLAVEILYSTSPGKPQSHKLEPPPKPPGEKLARVADFFFSQKMMTETFLPILADWRTEYVSAKKEGRWIKAMVVNLRWRLSFLWAMGLDRLWPYIKHVFFLYFGLR